MLEPFHLTAGGFQLVKSSLISQSWVPRNTNIDLFPRWLSGYTAMKADFWCETNIHHFV